MNLFAANNANQFGQGYREGAVRQENERRNALTSAIQQSGPRSPQAMNALAGVNPVAAMQMGQPQPYDRAALGQLVQGVMAQPDEMRPQAWGLAVQQAQAMGVPVPPEFMQYPGDEAAMVLSSTLGMGDDERTAFEREIEGLSDEERRQAIMIRAGLAPRAQSGAANPTFRAATPQEAAQYGATAGQIDTATGRFYPGQRPPSGTRIETGPNGELLFAQGAGVDTAQPLGRSGQNTLDGLEIDARKSSARLDAITQRIAENPELLDSQSLTGQVRRMGLEWRDFITGGDLDPEQAEYLTQVTQLRADVLDNLNFTIKEITGAAMTEAEAKRIGGTLPNVNDSPTMFAAKLDAAQKRTRLAIARYNHWRNGGFEGAETATDAAPLGDMEDIMRDRGRQLYQDAMAAGLSAEEARMQAATVLSDEFGV